MRVSGLAWRSLQEGAAKALVKHLRPSGLASTTLTNRAQMCALPGIGLADVVAEKQEPAAVALSKDSSAKLQKRLADLEQQAAKVLHDQVRSRQSAVQAGDAHPRCQHRVYVKGNKGCRLSGCTRSCLSVLQCVREHVLVTVRSTAGRSAAALRPCCDVGRVLPCLRQSPVGLVDHIAMQVVQDPAFSANGSRAGSCTGMACGHRLSTQTQ